MKKYLIVYFGDTPECVEGFSSECERTCKGALHVNPGRQLTISEGELSHIKEKYKHMLPKLRVLSEMKGGDKKAADEAPSESKDAAPLMEEKPALEEPKKHKGKKFRR